jgi:branched-chain amino acid aminotransferase
MTQRGRLFSRQQRRQQPHMPAERRLRRVLLSLQPLPERGAPHAAAAAAAAAAAGSSSSTVVESMEAEAQPEMRWGGTKEQMADFFVLHNGELMQEKDVKLSRQDADGFVHGCFDTTRTFGGEPFRMVEHVARLFQTMKFLGIKSPYTAEEYIEQAQQVLAANSDFVSGGDVWIFWKVSPIGFHPETDGEANVIVNIDPIPFAARTAAFAHGIECQVSSVRRAAPEAMSPRVKANANYLNLMLAEREVQAVNKQLVQLQLDDDGHLCEGNGANLFLVKDGVVRTPRARTVLEGISRQVAIELCATLGCDFMEDDLDVFDAYVADEAFITSTSWCLCGIRTINGRTIGMSTVEEPHGPVTRALMDAYKELVGFDFEEQYLNPPSA